MAVKCHQGWTSVKIQDNTVQMGILHRSGRPTLWQGKALEGRPGWYNKSSWQVLAWVNKAYCTKGW